MMQDFLQRDIFSHEVLTAFICLQKSIYFIIISKPTRGLTLINRELFHTNYLQLVIFFNGLQWTQCGLKKCLEVQSILLS